MSDGSKADVIAIVGVTASGKTAVGERVARELGGEVVCADSRQVYRELEIGTGKPTPEERALLPHHLFDALSLGETGSAGWYARAARKACERIRARGSVPILVGGSGLYLHAARRGLAAVPPQDPEVRRRILSELERVGPAVLYERLRQADPETAARLTPGDRQRISRALEVVEATGKPLSWWHRRDHGPAVQGRWRSFEIVLPPAETRRRIARRTQAMFSGGLLEEVGALLHTAAAGALRALRAIGYDEAIGLIEGRLDRGAAEMRTNSRTAQLAKRQRTWFRHQMEADRVDGGLGERALVERVLLALR